MGAPSKKKDEVCGVIRYSTAGTELICLKPKHVRLRLVKPGDTAQDFLNEHIPHAFETRFPYRKET